MNWIQIIQAIAVLEPAAIELILGILKIVAAAPPPAQQAFGRAVALALRNPGGK